MKEVVRVQQTRWSELAGDANALVTLITALKPTGLDVHFMNRPGIQGVTDPLQLSNTFSIPPSGGTPMISSIKNMYRQYTSIKTNVLLIVVTYGEPSDGEYSDLFAVLMNKPSNFYISLVECNDNEEEMDYLTGWDSLIPRFHNQEDYGEELNLVRRVMGPNTKFTRANYVQMIVLSPIYLKYAVDMRTAGGKRNPFGGKSSGAGYNPNPNPNPNYNYNPNPNYNPSYQSATPSSPSNNNCCVLL